MKLKTLLFLTGTLLYASFLSAQPKEITVEKIWKEYLFSPKGVPGFNALSTGDFYTVYSSEGIDKHSFETGEKVASMLSNEQLRQQSNGSLNFKKINDYHFDRSENRILLAIEKESIFRRSSSAYYYVYDRQGNSLQELADTAKGKQSFAEFSPDGKMVAFVREYNLFVKDLANNREIQITNDGKENHIRNGFADWVYEEELSLTEAFEWSPDGSKIAYMRFDESRVKEFPMTIFGSLYPEMFKYKYPKAGEDNSLVDIFIYDVKTGNKTKLDLGDNSNCYFPRIYWLSNSTDLIILKLNRHQNQLEFFRYNANSLQQDVVFTDKNHGWIKLTNSYYFSDDNQTMLTTSERDGYNHIYQVAFDGTITQLTKGEWEVADICAVDYKKKLIYYLSNESGTLNRDLYVINFSGKKKTMLTSGNGWNRVTFSPTMNFYMSVFSNNDIPPQYTIHKSDGKQLRVLQNNAAFSERIQEYGFTPKEFFNFTTKESVSLNGWMIKPPHFDPNKKHPVLMYVYGGPGSQEVSNSWMRGQDYAWYQMLAQKGYIVVCVDGRGTAGRGDLFKKSIYKQMGKLETEDQISTAQYLQTLPYVDPDRIGIWGWSFGGYLSSLAMFKGEGLFKAAIAVAPVTNWRYYDNIYTERFLQTPQENPEGYDDNSPIFHANKLKGAYLLVHGMADDNVHFQNSVDLTSALIKHEKKFDTFFYPNMNHFINQGTARYHLYVKMTDFILENL